MSALRPAVSRGAVTGVPPVGDCGGASPTGGATPPPWDGAVLTGDDTGFTCGTLGGDGGTSTATGVDVATGREISTLVAGDGALSRTAATASPGRSIGRSETGVFDEAVDGAMASTFRNCGQVCCSSERILVEKPIYDKFVSAAAPDGFTNVRMDVRQEANFIFLQAFQCLPCFFIT